MATERDQLRSIGIVFTLIGAVFLVTSILSDRSPYVAIGAAFIAIGASFWGQGRKRKSDEKKTGR